MVPLFCLAFRLVGASSPLTKLAWFPLGFSLGILSLEKWGITNVGVKENVMNLIKKQRENRYRLGELFLETGIVDVSAVSEGLAIAKRTSFPIGRVLVMTGWVDDHDIKCALELQNLLREGTIDNSLAKDLLRYSHTNKVDISESFRLNGLSRNSDTPQSRLSRLLLASGVLDEARLAQANRESERHGVTLGAAMVMLQFITAKTLEGCLNLQIMIRDNKVTFPEALKYAKEMHDRQVSLREVLGDNGKFFRANSAMPRLGELLVSAQLTGHKEVLAACEIGTEEDENIGRVMLQRGYINESLLEAALKLQRMVASRVITFRRAVKLIRLVARLGATVEDIVSESQNLDRVFALLRRAEIVHERLVRDVACEIIDYEDTVAEAMLAKGFINPIHARLGLALLEKIDNREISEAKATFLLHHCCRYPGEEMAMYARINWAELKRLSLGHDLLS